MRPLGGPATTGAWSHKPWEQELFPDARVRKLGEGEKRSLSNTISPGSRLFLLTGLVGKGIRSVRGRPGSWVLGPAAHRALCVCTHPGSQTSDPGAPPKASALDGAPLSIFYTVFILESSLRGCTSTPGGAARARSVSAHSRCAGW